MEFKNGEKVIVTEAIGVRFHQGEDAQTDLELIEKGAVGLFKEGDDNLAIIRPAEGQEEKFLDGSGWYVNKNKLKKYDSEGE